jgi:hypothetical protein
MDYQAVLATKKQLTDLVEFMDYFEGETTIAKLKRIPPMLAAMSDAGLCAFVTQIRQSILTNATQGYYRDTLPYLLQIAPFPLGSAVVSSTIGLDDNLDDALLGNVLWALLDNAESANGLVFQPVEQFIKKQQLHRAVTLLSFVLDMQLDKGPSEHLGREFFYVLSRFPYEWPTELNHLLNAHLPLISCWAKDPLHWYETFMAIPSLCGNGYAGLADQLFANFALDNDTIDPDVLDLIQNLYGNDALAEKVHGYFMNMTDDSMTPKEVSDLMWFVDNYPAMDLPPTFIHRLKSNSKSIRSVAAGVSHYCLESELKNPDKLNGLLSILIDASSQRATAADLIVKSCQAAGVDAAQVVLLSCLRAEQLEVDLGL